MWTPRRLGLGGMPGMPQVCTAGVGRTTGLDIRVCGSYRDFRLAVEATGSGALACDLPRRRSTACVRRARLAGRRRFRSRPAVLGKLEASAVFAESLVTAKAAPPTRARRTSASRPCQSPRSRTGLVASPTPCARVFVNGRPGRRWVILIFERRPGSRAREPLRNPKGSGPRPRALEGPEPPPGASLP